MKIFKGIALKPLVHPSHPATLTHEAGFTLLELIIVIILISIAFGISVVSFSNRLPSERVDATAREMIAMFRQAHTEAATTGRLHVLNVEIDARQYGIEGGVLKSIPDDVSIKIADPSYGELISGEYRFTFGPFGSTEGGTIILSSGKKTVAIQTDPVLGALLVQLKK